MSLSFFAPLVRFPSMRRLVESSSAISTDRNKYSSGFIIPLQSENIPKLWHYKKVTRRVIEGVQYFWNIIKVPWTLWTNKMHWSRKASAFCCLTGPGLLSRLFWHSCYQRCHHKCQSYDRKISQNIKCYLIWSMKCTFFAQFNFNSQQSMFNTSGAGFVIRLRRLVQSNFKGNNINKSLPRTLTKRTTLTLQWVWL